MQWSRRRRLAIIGVVAVLGIIFAVVPSGGSAASKKSFCSSSKNTKHVTARDVQRYAHRAIHRIYIICEIKGGKVGKPGAPGKVGPPGATGPAGPAGAAGQNAIPQEIMIPRTTINFTSCCQPDGGNIQNLAKVGPIHVDGLCRRTFPGPNGTTPFGGGEGTVRYPDPNFPATRGGENEAQVIVWSETGSMSFKGAHGHRENIPAGPPDYTNETLTYPTNGTSNTNGTDNPVKDPVAGEGDHLFLSATDEYVNEARGTDPATNPGHENDPGIKQLPEYPAFQYTDGIVATSDGHTVLADMLAGMDVLGVYGECVFAGVVRPLS